MSPTIALGIPHAPWKPERVVSLERLMSSLGYSKPAPYLDPGGWDDYQVEAFKLLAERCHYTTWATELWTFLEESGADWGLTLQDDTLVAPNFWRIFRAMLEGLENGQWPAEVICLESAHASARAYHVEGQPWFTTSDMLIGTAYAAHHNTLRDFRDWRNVALKPGAFDGEKPAITEDTLFGLFCLVTGRKIWCPTVTIVDHDLAVPSTCGNDDHPNRRPLVRWNNADIDPAVLEDPGYWRPRGNVPHVGRGYGGTPHLARQWVKPEYLSEETQARIWFDDGQLELKRVQAAAKANLPRGVIPSVVIATPTRGNPTTGYMTSVMRTIHSGQIELVTPWNHAHWWMWPDDVVRTRSRMVREFLRSRCTHLWFLDADTVFEPQLIEGMMGVMADGERDFVAAPYPRKQIDWPSVAGETDPEARAMKFDIQPLENEAALDARKCIEIARIGFGCVLLSRKGLLRMVEHFSKPAGCLGAEAALERLCDLAYRGGSRYDSDHENIEQWRDAIKREDLRCGDAVSGEMLALFGQRFTTRTVKDSEPVRDLLIDDVAFCDRWRETGQKIFLYLGQGAPASHEGRYLFRGLRESLFPAPKPLASRAGDGNEAPEPPRETPAGAPLPG